MGSTFASVYMSYRAMSAATAATSTIGNNISNMNTEGYTRQRTELESQTLSGFKSRYDQTLISTGNGVAATGTVQIRDTFLDTRYRAENADTGRYTALSSALTDVENVLDEISTKGMQSQFDNFINQLQNLSQYPTSKDIGLVVRTSAQQMTQMLNIYSNQLSQVRDQQAYDLATVTVGTDFNSIVESIANLNGQIREEYLYGNNPNELLDKRNSLIDELSGMANIKVTTTSDEVADGLFLEHVTISMYDEHTAASIGLVDHTKANTLEVHDDGENVSISMNTMFRLPNTPKNVDYDDITKYFTTGSISGYLDLLNGKGDYADASIEENDFRGVQYYQKTLDTFAKNFASVYNNLNNIEVTNATEDGKDALSLYQSAVFTQTLDAEGNYDTDFLRSYASVYNKFTFLASDGTTEIPMDDVKAATDFASSNVGSIKIKASDENAYKFIKNYIEEQGLVEDEGAGGDYTITRSDGKEVEITLTASASVKTASVVKALTPNKATDAEKTAIEEKYPVKKEADGSYKSILLQEKPLFAPADGSAEITAANIAISAEWIDNPLFITATKDFKAADGEKIPGGGNDNILRMISAISVDNKFYAEPGNEESDMKFTGTFNEYLISMGGTLALDVELNKNYLETSEVTLASLDNSRESVSGVSLDEEASNLLTFQSAYNAAARYFTALDEMLDKLINSTGLVGR